jgi:hypothetical protein
LSPSVPLRPPLPGSRIFTPLHLSRRRTPSERWLSAHFICIISDFMLLASFSAIFCQLCKKLKARPCSLNLNRSPKKDIFCLWKGSLPAELLISPKA